MIAAIGFVLLWFGLVFTLSLAGWFEQFAAATLFGMGAIASASGFVILRSLSVRFRKFLRAGSLRRLTYGQTLRFYGILAFFKAYQDVLPVGFAVPTGMIDVAFAVSSFWVAARLVSPEGRAKRGFVAWHLAGLGGLGISVILAFLTSSTRFGLIKPGITIQGLVRFPMSLVPTFVGPMVVIFHLLALASAGSENASASRNS